MNLEHAKAIGDAFAVATHPSPEIPTVGDCDLFEDLWGAEYGREPSPEEYRAFALGWEEGRARGPAKLSSWEVLKGA